MVSAFERQFPNHPYMTKEQDLYIAKEGQKE